MNIDLILSQITLGQYISPIKLGVFMALILGWLPILVWVHKDSEEVRTNMAFWTGIVFAVPAIAAILSLFIPFFVIGILVFLIAIIAVSIVYIIHRNALVSDFEKVLTSVSIPKVLLPKGPPCLPTFFIKNCLSYVDGPTGCSNSVFGICVFCRTFEVSVEAADLPYGSRSVNAT